LITQVDPYVGPPRHVLALVACKKAAGLFCLLVDQCECGELDPERGADLVEQHSRGRFGIGRACQSLGDRSNGLEPPPTGGDELLELIGLTRARLSLEQAALPTSQER